MLFVLPATSATRPVSYHTPQSYEYHPSHGYYPYRDAPRFAAPPRPLLDFFHQPSVEELEEHEYQRALEVIANHRRRQIEKEATIRRQQLAEAARQRYFTALAAELEQQRQEELLAARRSEFIRSQQARARLIATERQHALDAFLGQLGGARPVRHIHGILVVCVILTGSSPQVTHQPHAVKRRRLTDTLTQRLAAESDTGLIDLIQNILPSLESRPVQSEKPKDSGEDAAKIIEDLLSSVLPGLEFRTHPQPTPQTEQDQPSVSDKGKGKARGVDFEKPHEPAPTSRRVDEAFADVVRHVMELSKRTPTPRSPDEAGPSGLPRSSPPAAQPTVTEREQAQIDRAIALSSIEHARSTLTKLQTGFVLPTGLDHYAAPSDDRDEVASAPSASSSELAKLIPCTRTNKPVYNHENELNGLLEELDKIDSHGDAEVREKRKEVVKAVEMALEGVERVVAEAIEKRLSSISSTTPAAEVPLKGFDVTEDITDEVVPAREPDEILAVVDERIVPTPYQVEATDATSAVVSPPVDEAVSQSNGPVSEATADQPLEPTSTQSGIEASTATITPASVTEPKPEPAQPQIKDEAPEVVDTFLLPERLSPPSPIKKSREVDIDTDDEVLVLDSDAEKSDWSELEGH